MAGDGAGTFDPLRNTTRAEAAKAIANLLGLLNQAEPAAKG